MDMSASRTPSLRGNQQLKSVFDCTQTEPKKNTTKSIWHEFLRIKLYTGLSKLEYGSLTIIDTHGSKTFGSDSAKLSCTLTIHNHSAYSNMVLGGSNGSAEAYLQGLWSCDNPVALIRIMIRNRQVLDSLESGIAKIVQFGLKAAYFLQRNSVHGSKKNIAAHYDLGNDFFKLFLDERMMYSSALYEDNDDLESASIRKIKKICNTLALSEDDTVLEIGGGWGGFACFAARHYGCKITSITISKEQFLAAVELVRERNLSHLVTIKLLDYREIEGQFDKLISIEMVEAVGHQYLDGYFEKVNSLLKPGGLALLQAIVIDDARYEQALKEVDYIKRYIFPGSFIPCYSVLTQSAGRSHLMLENLDDFGKSYAQTLRDWRSNYYQQQHSVQAMGFDQRFLRMWEFYLCYCEGGFEERVLSVGQLLFRKQDEI